MQQVEEIEQIIDSAKERLEQVHVKIKLLIESFENEFHIINVNDRPSEIKTMVRLP